MNKLEMCNQVLTANGFEVFLAADPAHVRQLFFAKVQPAIDVKVISWGDSMTMIATRALDDLMATPGLEVIRPSHRQPPL